MIKLTNKKGFTLIELLAAIVILAILIAVAIPAVTRYLNTARKGTFASNAQAAIDAVRNDSVIKANTSNTSYSLSQINALLEKKLEKSPYGSAYQSGSFVSVTYNASGESSYAICLLDANGNGIYGSSTVKAVAELDVNESAVKNNLGSVSCN